MQNYQKVLMSSVAGMGTGIVTARSYSKDRALYGFIGGVVGALIGTYLFSSKRTSDQLTFEQQRQDEIKQSTEAMQTGVPKGRHIYFFRGEWEDIPSAEEWNSLSDLQKEEAAQYALLPAAITVKEATEWVMSKAGIL